VIGEGLQAIEIVYWDQGGQADLRVEIKTTGSADSTYKVIGTSEFALFNPGDVPTLSATQDLVETSTDGIWAIRTGQDVTGTSSSEKFIGSDGRDIIHGGGGNDSINGGGGSDYIAGGKGNDVLTGGLGSDTFAWELNDHGTAGSPDRDIITDFDTATAKAGGDVLDLRDLLQGENSSNLTNYLHFTTSNGSTVINISSTGAYGSGFADAKTDQVITLNGVTLSGSTDTLIIQNLINGGKLIVD
jgi:Ca2+-binding RTX toxin-like protein